jgi:hypothetical protein
MSQVRALSRRTTRATQKVQEAELTRAKSKVKRKAKVIEEAMEEVQKEKVERLKADIAVNLEIIANVYRSSYRKAYDSSHIQSRQLSAYTKSTTFCSPFYHIKLSQRPVFVRGHPSGSLPFLSSPTLPLFICISPTPLYHLQGPHPKLTTFVFKVRRLSGC